MQLYHEGTHEILVKAHRKEFTFTLNVCRHTFPENVELKDVTAPFTGEPYSACVEGSLPAGTKVTYSNGNSFVNVGNYECFAILTCEGYVTKQLKCNVNIVPAEYDMSGVYFENEENRFTYDGRSKSVSLKGELPNGVTVSYTIGGEIGNSAIKVNEYTVKASFVGDGVNYLPIPDKTTKLIIEKATISTEAVGKELAFSAKDNATYDGKAHNVPVPEEIPNGVNVTGIKYYDANGSLVENMVNAGEYLVEVTLAVLDDENYKLSVEKFTTTYTINKQLIVSNDIYFDNGEVFYDGKPHTLTVTGEHVEGLSIVYEVEGETETEFTEVGIYNFKATIPEDDNYEYEEVVREATLTIVAIKSGYGDITDSKIKREVYTGEEFGWDFSFIPECLNYNYTLKTADGENVEHPVTVGSYIYTVHFLNTRNYNDVPNYCEYYLEITPATMVIPDNYSKERAFEYTGEGKEYPASTPSEDISVTVEYPGRDTLPVEIGTYDVQLTFSKENYFDVVKATKLIINNAIIYDNINFATTYLGLVGGSKPYNDGNPIDFSAYENKVFSAKRIARNDEIPEGLYYYGENGADIPVKVSLEYYEKGSNEKIDTVYEVGEYEINFVYSFVNPSETGYVKYDGERVNFTVTKVNITFVDGVDYMLGEHLDGITYDRNWSELSNSNPDIKVKYLNEKIGNNSSSEFFYRGYTTINSDGEDISRPKELGNYTLVFTFDSIHYNVTAETTWEIRHVNLDNYNLEAYFTFPTGRFKEGQTVWPTLMINGKQVYANFNENYRREVTYNGMSPDISIEYEIVFSQWGQEDYWEGYSYLHRLQGTWKRDTDIIRKITVFSITGFANNGDGAYYFKFIVTNGAGEQKVFYGDLPEESRALDKSVVTDSKYCAVRFEPDDFNEKKYGE